MEFLLDGLLDVLGFVVGSGAAVRSGGVRGCGFGGLFGIGITIFLSQHSNGQLGNNSRH